MMLFYALRLKLRRVNLLLLLLLLLLPSKTGLGPAQETSGLKKENRNYKFHGSKKKLQILSAVRVVTRTTMMNPASSSSSFEHECYHDEGRRCAGRGRRRIPPIYLRWVMR